MDDAALALDLVRSAGTLAAQMRERGLEVSHKTSISDVVTAADHAAEEMVVERLRELRPADGILGEEGAAHDSANGRRWVIDPVDGTYNFASGLPYWCSAVALEGGGGALLGAIYQPTTQDAWVGGTSTPTTLNGEPLPPLVDRPLAECSIATYLHPPRLNEPDAVEPWAAMVRSAATVRMLGSGSCDLASVATGRIGAWAQHSCPDWDWLPGQAIVEAAGGSTAVIEHRGLRWHLAGNHEALAELQAALLSA